MVKLIPQKNKADSPNNFIILRFVANVTITSMLLFVAAADLIASIYQFIYFSIKGIPKIDRSKYVKMSRHRLGKLTMVQKWACWYCEYVNGVIAWIKAVANQTEIYSCAIKYQHGYPGQEYQDKFYEQREFKTDN